MPASARIHVALVNFLGLAAVAYCTLQFAFQPESGWLALAALTVITSSLAIRFPIPGGRAGQMAITVSDCFVFVGLLVFGPVAAALTAAIDGLVTNLRFRVARPDRFAFNVSVVSLDAYLMASLFALLNGGRPASNSLVSPATLAALGVTVVAYFLFNSGVVAAAMGLYSGQPILDLWKDNFPWASPTMLTNTLAALFFILAWNRPGSTAPVVFAALGILSLALSGFHLLRRKRRATEKMSA